MRKKCFCWSLPTTHAINRENYSNLPRTRTLKEYFEIRWCKIGTNVGNKQNLIWLIQTRFEKK